MEVPPVGQGFESNAAMNSPLPNVVRGPSLEFPSPKQDPRALFALTEIWLWNPRALWLWEPGSEISEAFIALTEIWLWGI